IDVLLNSMNEKELVVIEATAEGIKKARETEVPE
ncbi:transcriptional regulator, partial [Clostridioides difficile]|nr:transcriptional regulator [Clostridioides difficile]MBZ0638026.1 transcriptional regulator [Clostridioides difficile]MBZ0930382.1 transcriptional regulator [Clostridioides difficile]